MYGSHFRRVPLDETTHQRASLLDSVIEDFTRLSKKLGPSDQTRVITFQLARETSNRTYPEIGVNEPHHPLTHHGNDPEKIAKVAQINRFHVSLFAEFLQ